MNKVQLYRRFFFFYCLKKLLSCGRWGMCEKLGYDMAFLGVAVVPMKLKRFRETRKFYPCILSVYQIQYDTFSYHIALKAIRKYSLHYLAYHIIQSYIISNTITSSIKYYNIFLYYDLILSCHHVSIFHTLSCSIYSFIYTSHTSSLYYTLSALQARYKPVQSFFLLSITIYQVRH